MAKGDTAMTDELRAQPPTDWVEQLDEAIERLTNEEVGQQPADLVAGWLMWYAQQLAGAVAAHRLTAQRLERATRLAQQLTDIIVEELKAHAMWNELATSSIAETESS